jgi:hypothetical protein
MATDQVVIQLTDEQKALLTSFVCGQIEEYCDHQDHIKIGSGADAERQVYAILDQVIEFYQAERKLGHAVY